MIRNGQYYHLPKNIKKYVNISIFNRCVQIIAGSNALLDLEYENHDRKRDHDQYTLIGFLVKPAVVESCKYLYPEQDR